MKWQQRLNEHEVAPHPQLWDALKDRMALQDSGMRRKMLDMEVPPPAHSWNDIRQQLAKEAPHTETPRIPLIRQISRRYVSAAAMTASVILLTVLFIRESSSNSDKSPALTAAMKSPLRDIQLPSDPTPSSPGTATPPETDKESTALSNPTLPPVPATIPTSSHSSASKRNISNPRTLVQIEPDNNYIRICGRPAECDRLTYKLEEWAPCIHESTAKGQGALELTEEERRIESWRKNLEQSDYIPAAGHFLDILEMVSMLNRERK